MIREVTPLRKNISFALLVLFFFTIGSLQWSKNESTPVQPQVKVSTSTKSGYTVGHSELRVLRNDQRVRLMTGTDKHTVPVPDWTAQQQPQVRTADGKCVENYPLIPDAANDHTRMCDQ